MMMNEMMKNMMKKDKGQVTTTSLACFFFFRILDIVTDILPNLII